MIIYKTPEEIKLMQEGGAILATILQTVSGLVAPGITTQELENEAAKLMKKFAVEPLFKGFEGFPAVTCTSVNEQVVHGIPRSDVVLAGGDIVSIDAGIRYKGVCLDSAVTVAVGTIAEETRQLMHVTKTALEKGIQAARVGNTIGDIGHAVSSYVASQGSYGVIKALVGHGIGHELHEEPQVPNYGNAGSGIAIEPGLVIAIEPMITLGSEAVVTAPDGWTIQTQDKSLSAHFEHTIAIMPDKTIILTTR